MIPTARETRAWLQATAGLVDPAYTALTVQQQVLIVQDLKSDDREECEPAYKNPLYPPRRSLHENVMRRYRIELDMK